MVTYSDASLTNGHVGIGFKLYQPPTSTEDGKTIDHRSHKFLENGGDKYTSVMAEYLAVIEAAKTAQSFDVDMLLLTSDCQGVVEKIQKGIPVTSDAHLRDELFDILDGFNNWRVKQINRDRNDDAHEEARKAIRRSQSYSGL